MYNKLKICKLIGSIGSQEKAAKELGISVGTIKNICAGKDTKISTLETICNYFNMPIGALFTEARGIYHSVTNGNGSAASVMETQLLVNYPIKIKKSSTSNSYYVRNKISLKKKNEQSKF